MFIGVQLLGPLAIESMPQLGDQVILTLGLGPQAWNFGLHGQKRLPHGRRKAIQLKGVRARRGHTESYRIRPQKPIFTRRSESLCRGWNGGSVDHFRRICKREAVISTQKWFERGSFSENRFM